jgi:GEL complex subunit OPTI
MPDFAAANVLLQKVLSRDSDWEKEDLCDVLYWGRQMFAVVAGIVWGVLAITGFLGIAGYAALAGFVFFSFYTKVLEVDDEEFGRWDLATEGFGTAFGVFMVSWICTYSTFHA